MLSLNDENGGFVAYRGKELNKDTIKNVLNQYAADASINSSDEILYYANVYEANDYSNIILAQINEKNSRHSANDYYTFPHYYGGIWYVASYDTQELENFIELYEEYYYPGENSEIFAKLLIDYDYATYRLLDEQLSESCFAGYYNSDLVAASMGNGELYYGYTKKNNEIIISDIEEVIQELCGYVVEFPENSYYKNGNFYKYYDEDLEIVYKDIDKLKPNDNSNNKLDIEEYNKIEDSINSITDVALLNRIKRSIYNFFENGKADSLIEELFESKVLEQLDINTLKIIETRIKDYDKFINKKTEEAISNKIKENSPLYSSNIIISDNKVGSIENEIVHSKFELATKMVLMKEITLFSGPYGCGKKVVAQQIAKCLDRSFANLAINNLKDMLGTFGGEYFHYPAIGRVYQNGGVVYIEDYDKLDESIIKILEQIMSSESFDFGYDYAAHRSPNFYIIGSHNTHHPDERISLDLNGNIVPFEYDKKLEKSLYTNQELLDFMWTLRDNLTNYKDIASTEKIGSMYKKLINKVPINAILTAHNMDSIRNYELFDTDKFITDMEEHNDNMFYKEFRKKLGK